MKKFTLLIASLFITMGAMAQTVVTAINTSKYYTIECRSGHAHNTARFIADDGTVINGQSSFASYFVFEGAEGVENGYYIKSEATGKYINSDGSIVTASTDKATVWTLNVGGKDNVAGVVAFGLAGDKYLNNNGTKSDGTCNNLQPNSHSGGPGSGNACSLWELKEYENVIVEKPEQFVNGKVYTFVTERGAMGASATSNNAISTARNATADTNSDYFKWSVYKSENGKYYLYNVGKQQFLGLMSSAKDAAVPMSDTPAEVTFTTTNLTGYPIMFTTLNDGSCVANHSYYIGEGLITWNGGWTDLADTGNGHIITKTGELDATTLEALGNIIKIHESDNTIAKEELGELIDYVIGADQVLGIIGDKVGQRNSTMEGWVSKFSEIVEFHNNITKETTIREIEEKTAELQAIIDSFTIINMPVDGKAYTFKSVQKNGTTICWFTYNETTGKLEVTTDEASATAFVCRKLDNGNYAFACNAGKYIAWRGTDNGGVGYNNCSGVCDAYDATWSWFTVEKMTTGNNINDDQSATRYMLLKGRRLTTVGDNEFNYIVIKRNDGNPVFDQANAPFYNDNFSSAFIIDEVEYANKPKLNNVGTSALITSDLHNKAMGTFSAPFATVVPAGVTAYYAADGNGYITLNAIEEGKAIPANTGVILVADEAGERTMSPAAGEEEADNSNNALSASAGAAKEIGAGCYVLSAKNGVAGFYPTTAGTIAMNKAYIAAVGGQNAIEVRLPGTTGIEEITDNRVQSTVIYDLTGRRVEAITAPGIYVVNGKKVLVK